MKQTAEAILLRTFPISVVERDGNNVVLSQGGQAVAENARYRIYLQGKELKDPQTGQSLGNMESLCCEVVVNRVTPNLSYGTLENVTVDLKNVQAGALQIRESVSGKNAVKLASGTSDSANQASGDSAVVAVAVKTKPSATHKPATSAAAQKESKQSNDW